MTTSTAAAATALQLPPPRQACAKPDRTVRAMGCKVWIDQDLCTGDGLCADTAPDVFVMAEDGLAYVKEPSWPNLLGPSGHGPGPVYQMAAGRAAVGDMLVAAVVAAAEQCPGECIFVDQE